MSYLSPLDAAELDALFARLLAGGRKLERHTYYVYNRVPEDYARTLQAWRENNEVRRDVLRAMNEA